MEKQEKQDAKNEPKKMGLYQKLMAIQRAVKTFDVSELSDKLDPKTGKPAYTYTPTWKITEAIREKMDEMGLMLIPQSCTAVSNTPIEYPVYLMIGNEPRSFTKKEIFSEVRIEFVWLDTETGERSEPYIAVGCGANGTDKSYASAVTLAKRYFLMNFFHFSTREASDEPDAHDSNSIPGLKSATPASPMQAAGAPAAQRQSQPQRQNTPQAPTGNAGGRVNSYPTPPEYNKAPAAMPPQGATTTQQDFQHPAVVEAIQKLAQFDMKTASHAEVLNRIVGDLFSKGFQIDQTFVDNLNEAGQAMRENRAPRYVQ